MYASSAPLRVDQGAIVEGVYFYAIDEVFHGVVLTPTCDIAQNKAELLVLCAAINAWDLVSDLIKTDWKNDGLVSDTGELIAAADLSQGKRKTLRDKIQRLMRQQFPRYHWLAPIADGKDPLIADFQILACVAPEEIDSARIVASLESPFREQVPTRYAAYVGRIGTPDIPPSVQDEWVDAGLQRLFAA